MFMRYIIQLISLRKPKKYQIFLMIHNYCICRKIKKEILSLRELDRISDFTNILYEYLSFINLLKDNGFDIINHLHKKVVLTTSFPKICLKFAMNDRTEVSMILTLTSSTKACSVGYLIQDCAFREIELLDTPRVIVEDIYDYKYKYIDDYKGKCLDFEVINETIDFIIQSSLVIFKEFLYINQ